MPELKTEYNKIILWIAWIMKIFIFIFTNLTY